MFWIVYGIGIIAWPTIIVNSCVLAIHSYWFYKHRKINIHNGIVQKT
jgi:hypothetical protein